MANGAQAEDDHGWGQDDSDIWGASSYTPPSTMGVPQDLLNTDPGDPTDAWGIVPTDPGTDPNQNLTIPVNTDPTVTGSTPLTPTGGATGTDPTIDPDGLGPGAQGGGVGGGGSTSANGPGFPIPIPLPVDPAAAIALSVLINGAGSGGGGIGLPSLGGSASGGGGTTSSGGSSGGSGTTGPTGPTDPGATSPNTNPVIGWPGGSSSTSTPTPVTASGGNPDVGIGSTSSGAGSIVIPQPTDNGTTGNNGSNATNPPTPSPISTNAGTADTPPGGQQGSIIVPAPGGGLGTTTPPGGGLTTNNGTGTDTPPPGAPLTVVPTATTGGGGTSTTTTTGGPGLFPIVVPTQTNTTMPTTTPPDPRSYLNEGTTSASALQQLLSQFSSLYGGASQNYSNTDYANYNNIANQLGGSNSTLTTDANAQTQAANSALRQGNLGDVNSLASGALATNQSVNQPLYSALNNYTTAAGNNLSQLQATQAQSGQLSAQDLNTAQQAARSAWQARGLVNSPGAVGSEILNTNALQLQRQQQAISNTQTGLQNYGSAVSAQQANAFNPFSTVLGSQYGQQTNNTGSNATLFGQAGAVSSGALGNQFVENAYNPYNTYSQDLNNTNFNAANAQYISGQNNAAALQGANTSANASILNNFLGSLAGLYGSGAIGTCWVAREVYGVTDPRWLLFRAWLFHVAPAWFRNLYIVHGEGFAAWLKRHAWAKPMIRTFMDSRINRTYIFKEDFAHAL